MRRRKMIEKSNNALLLSLTKMLQYSNMKTRVLRQNILIGILFAIIAFMGCAQLFAQENQIIVGEAPPPLLQNPSTPNVNSSSNSGTEFYVAFGKNDTISTVKNNSSNTNVQLSLRITALVNTQVTLSFTEKPLLDSTFYILGGSIRDYILTHDQARACYSGRLTDALTKQKSIHVTATEPISLVAINSANANVEATLVWSVENYGTEYYSVGISQGPSSSYGYQCNGYLIIAKEDNTKVTHYTNYTVDPLYSTLQAGEVYFYYSSDQDSRGTRIVSDKPIAFFQNSTRSRLTVGPNSPRSNNTYEQYMPTNMWGNKFIVPTNDVNAIYARVYAKETTQISVVHSNGTTQSYTLSGGITQRYKDILIDGSNNSSSRACYITSDKPVAVCVYHFARWADEPSQPGEAWLPPIEQKVRNILVSPLDLDGTYTYLMMDHYLMIVTTTADKENTTISVNGDVAQRVENLSDFSWIADDIGGSGYSYGRYYLGFSHPPKGIFLHKTAFVENPKGFIALAYGQGSYTNYTYTVGSNKRDLTANFTVNEEYYYDMDGAAYCNTSDFVFQAVPNTLKNIIWTLNGQEIASGDVPTVYANNLAEGYYTINMIVNNTDHIATFYVGGGASLENGSNNTALTFWQNSTAPSLEAALGITAGSDLYDWFDNTMTSYSGAGNPINTNNTGLQTYYLSRKNNQCDGDLIEVNILIIAAQAPSYTVCKGENITLGVGTLSGVNFYWYVQETGGTTLSGIPSNSYMVTNATTSKTYWVEPRNTMNTFARISINLSVNEKPTAPTFLSGADKNVRDGEQITPQFLIGLLDIANGTTVEFYNDIACTQVFTTITTNYNLASSHNIFATSKNSATGCETASAGALKITINVQREKTAVIGTVFPFVRWNDREFDQLFPITVNLKSVPNPLATDPIGDLIAETPLYSTQAIYYDGTIFVPNSPKSPGAIGALNNYGMSINWDEAIHVQGSAPNTNILLENEKPNTVNGQTLGLYKFENVEEGDYILEIQREGYDTRWAKIQVRAKEPVQYLTHREIVPGDINSNLRINNLDINELKINIGGNFSIPNNRYFPKYDLNADGQVDQMDFNLVTKFAGFWFYHYKETLEWLEELGIEYK